MAVENGLLRWLIPWFVSRGLTGRAADLKRIIRVARRIPTTVAARRFFDGLESSLDRQEAMGELFLRIGRQLSRRSRSRLATNLLYNEFIAGYPIRRDHIVAGSWVPGFFVMSPTMRCNLACRGCYSAIYPKREELSLEEMDRILTEAETLGIYFVVISGGEPYLLSDRLLRLFRRHRNQYFLTYTNATLLDGALCRELERLGNVAPGISVEGFERETEDRRGPGVFSKVLKAMDLLRDHGVLFGFSATATRHNLDTISSAGFVRFYRERGALFGWYFLYIPVGREPDLDLAPTPDQRVELGRRVARLRNEQPIFLGDFWNDGPAVGGCMAGGRTYLHILSSGAVEPCVFCHFSSDSIHGKSLLEVANSPFFRAIRREFPYNRTGNLLRPCMIIDNPGVLRRLVEQHVVPAGHENADAIVRDPKAVAWADDYARRMEELTEPAWEAMVSDPSSRWYRGGPDYLDYLRPPILFAGERPDGDLPQPVAPKGP